MRLKKINKLKNGNLLFVYFSNNAGNGSNNCTLIIVPADTERPQYSKDNKKIINMTRTSAWRGSVNMSKRVYSLLNISKDDILFNE